MLGDHTPPGLLSDSNGTFTSSGIQGPVSDCMCLQLHTFEDEPLPYKLDGEHGNFTKLLDQVCLPLWGTILPPRLKTLTWGRTETAVKVCGRNKDLKTRARLT